MPQQSCFKARCFPTAELSDGKKVLYVYDYFTVELPILFLKSLCDDLRNEYFNSLQERKLCNDQTRKTQFKLFFLPIESCTDSPIFLRYRGAKLIKCLIETTLGTVFFG